MIPHKSRVKHNPPDTYGDCLRASVASVLAVDKPELVPHFFHDGCDAITAMKRMREYLRSHGLAPFVMGLPGDIPLQTVLEFMGDHNPEIYYLLFGQTEYGPHVVVCKDAAIVHDTAWYVHGIKKPTQSGVWQIVVFVRL